MFQNFPFDPRKITQAELNAIYDQEDGMEIFFIRHYKHFKPTYEYHPLKALELVFSCLNPIPELRPTIQEVMQHPWIRYAPKFHTEETLNEFYMIKSA
jgi:serine/threonine protein kinase